MAKIFITGSADGLGQLTAVALIEQGHEVVLHARDEARVQEALRNAPGAKAALAADLADPSAVKQLAEKINQLGTFDAVIHNAGVYKAPAAQLFAVNTIAPYLLTCLIEKPKRLIYLSSGMHLGGKPRLEAFAHDVNSITYSDTKLHMLLLAKAVARMWPDILSNAIDPGWVPTKMGGSGAPDSLQKGYETQVWLVNNNEFSGSYLHHKKDSSYNHVADDHALQDRFLAACEQFTGIKLN
ncbi:SDR family NAD(P)-dependent oxidoreductase [Mucilaginibacter sp. UR6-1]|uniref:SDR family NAD(P)-dependent oxidoreductase n=1 Tax=Mucilaginibacter sp. UR6-1 TaxID=1435643 RepID=UPI001E4E5CD2|nr:SDR family NAD(P)-dependent oxidoreductase [Mucilaginibacter sp. UR6-1]MCC8411267.1 SDR family NAD(P)-dependent oxidoreductase [Mucilaginibacter sp. UR6-1]